MKILQKHSVFLFMILFFVFLSPLQGQNIRYLLRIEKPGQHIATLAMQIPVAGADSLEVALPAWSPGRYVIYDFSRNLFDLQVLDGKGQALPAKLLDKQTWRITTRGLKTIIIKYKIFANTLDGSFSKIDSAGASINGAGVFLYVKKRKFWPVTLRIQVPENWQIASAMDRNQQDLWQAENYDRLVDSPIEMGKLSIYSFKQSGKMHRLVFHQKIKSELRHIFIFDLKKIIRSLSAVFGGNLPYRHYTFFYHLLPNLHHGDGMEHFNSCRVLLRMDVNKIKPDANTDPDYDNLIWLSAHEYFHTWNIKRLRPAGLGPFDYSKENYTPCLWIVEGLTSYYAYLSLIRSHIYTPKKLYSEFAGRIGRYERDPGKTHRTLSEVSMLTWLFLRAAPEYEASNVERTTYSYYYKGTVVGLLLDLQIRKSSNGRYALDDVMRALWEKFYIHAAQSNYYLPGAGYTEKDFEDTVRGLVGNKADEFFRKSVHEVASLDYNPLEYAGLKLEKEAARYVYHIHALQKVAPKQLKLRRDWLGQ